jgi:hypothetical protein
MFVSHQVLSIGSPYTSQHRHDLSNLHKVNLVILLHYIQHSFLETKIDTVYIHFCDSAHLKFFAILTRFYKATPKEFFYFIANLSIQKGHND